MRFVLFAQRLCQKDTVDFICIRLVKEEKVLRMRMNMLQGCKLSITLSHFYQNAMQMVTQANFSSPVTE